MTIDDSSYGNNLKKIVFEETDHQHAKFILRLRHNSISQSDFFRAVMSGFINSDERICSYIDDFVKDNKILSKQRLEKSRSLKKIGQQKIQDFGFSEIELEKLFDIIEEQKPEL